MVAWQSRRRGHLDREHSLRRNPRLCAAYFGTHRGIRGDARRYAAAARNAVAEGRAIGTHRAMSAAALIAFMVAQPVCGWMSDKVGRKTMLLVASAEPHTRGLNGQGPITCRRDNAHCVRRNDDRDRAYRGHHGPGGHHGPER